MFWNMQTRTRSFSQSTDKRLLAFYEGIRDLVDADARAGGRYRFDGTVRQFATSVWEEIARRRLKVQPIDWKN